jgi:hypothetical protein
MLGEVTDQTVIWKDDAPPPTNVLQCYENGLILMMVICVAHYIHYKYLSLWYILYMLKAELHFHMCLFIL